VLLRPRFWPAVAPLLGFCLAAITSPQEATNGFYTTAAQIIPVLLLVLAVELGFFRFRLAAPEQLRMSRGGRLPTARDVEAGMESAELAVSIRSLVALATLLALTVGEFVALHPVAQGDESTGNPRVVYGALAAGVAAIAALAVLGDRGHATRPRTEDD